MWYAGNRLQFNTEEPLLDQLEKHGFEFDQKLERALQVSASRPELHPEDVGFPDSYLTVALYQLNSILTRVVELDFSRLNLFHNYEFAPPCAAQDVVPGTRLCRVLDKAVDLAGPNKTLGVGHFLRAIVALTLDEEPEPAYGFPGQVLHNTFSAETLLWGLGYTAWTPVAEAPEVHNILQALDGREPAEDLQYLMTYEDDRIVFRPSSVLDAYHVRSPTGITSMTLALLTHFQDQYAAVRPTEILELEDLINNPRIKEDELQRFFEAHPHFFRMWDYRDVYPHVYLTREDEGPLIPDFILVDPELQKAMVLELKLPRPQLVVRKPNRIRFAVAIDEARAQLLEYRGWFEDSRNRAKVKDMLGMEIFHPRLGVIIGTSHDFRTVLERQKLASRYPDIEVVTYDDIVRHAQRRLLLVQGATRRR